MDQSLVTTLVEASAIGWIGALAGALFGLIEWYILPGMVETSIRSSKEGRKLSAVELDGVVSWWKTVIRVFAVSMPLLGFGLAASMAE
ncbi:MAG: hypothetical protein K0S00_3437 [Xanthobacteraceae bacterium]|jgi:hypothetical protein|nr:hypothetical protein [Xanthobacteraceae bacterium]